VVVSFATVTTSHSSHKPAARPLAGSRCDAGRAGVPAALKAWLGLPSYSSSLRTADHLLYKVIMSL
jgi:hypothetical protein